MRQGLLRNSRYSPGNMDRESLENLFVGRHDAMEDVLSRVTRSLRSLEKHYILLVGPRGSGKTHFLALAYHRLMDQVEVADAHDSVAVAMLNEEEWGVASFLDLVVRILRALADQAMNLDAEIAEIYDRFSKDSADAEGFAAELGALDAELAARIRACWPGPTTYLVPNTRFGEHITGGRDTVAVRVPGHAQARALARTFGGPLVSTSANRSGEPPCLDAEAVSAALGDAVDCVLPGTVGERGAPSRIVDARSGETLR